VRFNITWHNDLDNSSCTVPSSYGGYIGYKVSIPNYDGGAVVSIDEVKEIEDALILAKEQIVKNEYALKKLRAQLDELKRDDPGHT